MSKTSLSNYTPSEVVELTLDQRGVRTKLKELGIREQLVWAILLTREATVEVGMTLAWGIQHLEFNGKLVCEVREINKVIDMTQDNRRILEDILDFQL